MSKFTDRSATVGNVLLLLASFLGAVVVSEQMLVLCWWLTLSVWTATDVANLDYATGGSTYWMIHMQVIRVATTGAALLFTYVLGNAWVKAVQSAARG